MRRIASQQHDGRLAALRTRGLRPLWRPARGRRGVLRDRRGITSLVFAASAIAVLAFAGLGTEVGLWYLVRRDLQNAADAAAIAGALAANDAITATPPTDPGLAAQSAVTALSTTPGFLTGASLQVTPLPSYPYTTATGGSSSAPAVEVTASETLTPLFSAMFGNTQGVRVGAQSIAVVGPTGRQACALSLSGDLTISGNLTVVTCGVASNAADETAINVTSTGTLNGVSATTVGGCCGPGTVWLYTAAPYHPATPDPYATALATAGLPSFNTCTTPGPVSGTTITLPPYSSAANAVAYCNLTIDGNKITSVTLEPGTYFFYNASLMMTGGTLQCPACANGAGGVSLVFLATGPGNGADPTVSITSAASLTNLNAPTNSQYSALNGILFYDQGSSQNSALPSINLSGPTAQAINGAFYFPNTTLTFYGNAIQSSSCLSLVAGTLNLPNNFTLQCSATVPPLAPMQGVRLVQ